MLDLVYYACLLPSHRYAILSVWQSVVQSEDS